MKFEERINDSVRDALERRPSDLGAWERFVKRVGRQRTTRYAVTALVGAAAVAAAIVFVPRLGNDRNVTPIETPSLTSMPSTTPSPTATPASVPDEIVAIATEGTSNADDRIVVVSTATGNVVRVLAEAKPDAGPHTPSFAPELSLSPDGSTVYFVRMGEHFGCDEQIVSVPFAGGSEHVVVQGHAPALSPDGRYLAYSGKGLEPNCQQNPLVVRDLTNGEERRWTWAAEHPDDPYQGGGAFGLAWAPDSRHLAFYRNDGDPHWVTSVLDTSQGETLLDARLVGSQDEGWWAPRYLGDGTLALLHTVESIHSNPGGRQRVIQVDPSNGNVLSLLAPPAAGVTDLAVDRSGTFLVYVSTDGVFRVQDGEAIRVTTGAYQAVAW